MNPDHRRRWIAEKLVKLRKQSGWDQSGLKFASRQTLSKLENGKGEVEVGTLEAIVSGYGDSLANFFADYTTKEFQGPTGREVREITSLDEPWVELLLTILHSSDKTAIPAVESSLVCFEEKVREKQEAEKTRSGPKTLDLATTQVAPKAGSKRPKKRA